MPKEKKMYRYPIRKSDGWRKNSGDLPVQMTNDYLFRALLQSDNDTLKALLASLLKIDIGEIKAVKVTNEIQLGVSIDSKEFIMDVSVEFNDEVIINLEMQVIRHVWWIERSLAYICRSFDNLNRGMHYGEAKGVRQIAFCDFTLFKERPEFYATYRLLNEKCPEEEYSDKIVISNIDLTRIDLADETDKEYRVDLWARFFKAKTWEELIMLAEKDKSIEQAVNSAWQLISDPVIREQCRTREEWIVYDKYRDKVIDEQGKTIAEQAEEIRRLKELLKESK